MTKSNSTLCLIAKFNTKMGLWITVCFFPQLIYVTNISKSVWVWHIFKELLFFQALMIMLTSLGAKKSMEIIIQNPAIILTPVFSNWTIGPEKSYCNKNATGQKFKASFRLTWGNIMLSNAGSVALIILHTIFEDQINDEPYFHIIDKHILVKIACLCLALSFVSIVLLQVLPKCKELCCNCCQINCYPVYKKSACDLNAT